MHNGDKVHVELLLLLLLLLLMHHADDDVLLLVEILRKFWLACWSVAFVCLSTLYSSQFKSDLYQTVPADTMSQHSGGKRLNFGLSTACTGKSTPVYTFL